jgi:pyruvate,water dikinase
VTVVPLAEAADAAVFGGKAVALGEAMRSGLPVPDGIALATALVDALAAGDPDAIADLDRAFAGLETPVAARSSAVGEDSAGASFAGQHRTCLNVLSFDDLRTAVRDVWESACSESALAYRERLGLHGRPAIGVVVQRLVDAEVAGVLFTRNPLDGTDERVVEASWGLGEAVVAGIVVPDHFRLSRSGEILERTAGMKDLVVRRTPDGGTVEEPVAPGLVEQLCLDDDQLEQLNRLAERCEQTFGGPQDIEFAFARGRLYLLQSRPITRGA